MPGDHDYKKKKKELKEKLAKIGADNKRGDVDKDENEQYKSIGSNEYYNKHDADMGGYNKDILDKVQLKNKKKVKKAELSGVVKEQKKKKGKERLVHKASKGVDTYSSQDPKNSKVKKKYVKGKVSKQLAAHGDYRRTNKENNPRSKSEIYKTMGRNVPPTTRRNAPLKKEVPFPKKNKQETETYGNVKVPAGKGNIGKKILRTEESQLERYVGSGKKIRPRKPSQKQRTEMMIAALRKKVNKIKNNPSGQIPITHTRRPPQGPSGGTADTPESIIKDAEAVAKTPSYIAKDHDHTITFKGYKGAQYKRASLISNTGKYAKYWLLNAKQTNGNGWGVSQQSIAKNIHKFVGKPLVVTAKSWIPDSEYGDAYEHPYLPTNDINKVFDHQEKFRVGSIVDIIEKDGDYFANIELNQKFAHMVMPPFCSPAIFQNNPSEPEGQISDWEALHLAALHEDPAYGSRIALLRGTCVGTKDQCTVQFKAAKQEAKMVCTKGIKERIAGIQRTAITDVREMPRERRDDKPHVLHKRSTEIEEHGLKSIGESPTIKGSHFLTTGGKLMGNGKYEHRSMSHSILKNFKDKDFNSMAADADGKQFSRWGTDGRNMGKLLEQTGMSRISGDKLGINIDSKHPLTKNQMAVINQWTEDNNIGPDNIFIDDDTPGQDTIRKQLRLPKIKSRFGKAKLKERLATLKKNDLKSKLATFRNKGAKPPEENADVIQGTFNVIEGQDAATLGINDKKYKNIDLKVRDYGEKARIEHREIGPIDVGDIRSQDETPHPFPKDVEELVTKDVGEPEMLFGPESPTGEDMIRRDERMVPATFEYIKEKYEDSLDYTIGEDGNPVKFEIGDDGHRYMGDRSQPDSVANEGDYFSLENEEPRGIGAGASVETKAKRQESLEEARQLVRSYIPGVKDMSNKKIDELLGYISRNNISSFNDIQVMDISNENAQRWSKLKQRLAEKLIKDSEIRDLRQQIGPDHNFPDDGMKRSLRDSEQNFRIQTRGIARERLDKLTKKTRRDNPETPLINKVPFGPEYRKKKGWKGESLTDSDQTAQHINLDYTDENNPISRPEKPKRQDWTRIISAKKAKLKQRLAAAAPTTKINQKDGETIANAYDKMLHNPNDSAVKESYNALIGETNSQFNELKKNGLRIDPIKEGTNPYQSADDLHNDLKKNNHIYYYPSEKGFGSGDNKFGDHPLLSESPSTYKGKKLLNNDVFRIVHDVNGHNLANSNFSPEGEHNAFLQHRKMYSPLAGKALFTETAAQSNWGSWNKKSGASNRKLIDAGRVNELEFADQKAGLLSDDIINTEWHTGETRTGKLKQRLSRVDISESDKFHKRLNRERDYVSDLINNKKSKAYDKHGNIKALPDKEIEALDKYVDKGTKIRPPKPTQKDRKRIISAKQRLGRLIKGKQRNAVMSKKVAQIINSFKQSGFDPTGISGVWDSQNSKNLNAYEKPDLDRIWDIYGRRGMGFNSVTNTIKGPNNDIGLIAKQLTEIEEQGGIPALGFDNGSLEAVNVTYGTKDEVLNKLLPHQNSTGYIDEDGKLDVPPNPRYQDYLKGTDKKQ